MNKNILKSLVAFIFVVAASMFGFSTAFGYGGGGSYSSPCASVVYGEWGDPVNGIQYREIVSQLPTYCSLSTSQQLDRSRTYVKEVIIPEVTTPEVVVTEVVIPIKKVLGEKVYADGTLVRYKGDSKIYVYINGIKHHIKTLAELQKYAGQEIINITPNDLEEKVLGEKVYADGSLLRGADHKVYVLIDGKLKHIRNLAELQKYAGQKINDVDDSVISSLK